MNNGGVEVLHLPTQDDMERIQKFSHRKLMDDEVFIFSITICNNDIDADYERFSSHSVFQMAEKYLGKTGIAQLEEQTAYPVIFDTGVRIDPDRKVDGGVDDYVELIARAYFVKRPNNLKIVDAITTGDLREVSVACSVKRTICSICGKGDCTAHQKSLLYDGYVAHKILADVSEVFDWAFVAKPEKPHLKVKVNRKRNTYYDK